MVRKIVSAIMLSLLVMSMLSLAFRIQIVKADDEAAQVYFSVEPVAVAPLANINSSINGLETPSTPSPTGQNFTVQIHLRNATATNAPAGVGSLEVHFYFGNILNYCSPIGFTDMLGQPGGVLTGPHSSIIYAIFPGFYDNADNAISASPYTGATQYIVAAVSTGAGWNGTDGLVAEITFQITGQPSSPQPDFYAPLQITYTGLWDSNIDDVPSYVVQGSLHIDARLTVHNINTGLNYSTIQGAIGAPDTLDGQTILVEAGTYNEQLTINKRLSIVGDGIENTTIYGGGTDNVVYIIADGVNLTGFRIRANPILYPPLADIALDGVSNCNIYGNSMPDYDGGDGIYLQSSSNNIISGNIVRNKGAGLWLSYSSNNIVTENEITAGAFGVIIEYASNNSFFHNYLNGWQVYFASDSANIWDNGYPSGGNYWSGYTGADIKKGPTQDQPGSDNIGDTPYVIPRARANNVDHYPLMNLYGSPPPPTHSLTITATAGGTTNPPPGDYTFSQGQTVPVQAAQNIGYVFDHWELDGVNRTENPINVMMDQDHILHAVFMIHDVAVTDVAPSKAVVGQGFNATINVTVANQGDCTETFNVTAYANATIIESENVTLPASNSTTVTFTWNTVGFAYGNYTLSSIADTVPGETNTTNNNFTDGAVTVTIPGDLNGDFVVNLMDVVILGSSYGSRPGDAKWNPNADIDGNGVVGLSDLAIMAYYYGQHYP